MLSRSAFVAGVALVAACGDSASTEPPSILPARSCTAIGCVPGVSVKVASYGTWKAGNYVVTVVADGVTTTCSATIPAPDPFSQCSDRQVYLGVLTSSIGSVSLESTPASVRIEIAHEGTTIAAQTFTLVYKQFQPNGADCPPICPRATATLIVMQ